MTLPSSKRKKIQNSLKGYLRQYLRNEPTELDESGTRIMVNSFLTEVLGYRPIEDVKTEYMINGTYADYVVQLNGVRHFLVEVKSLSLKLSDKHLRQAINYGANEGIDWAMLTNGKSFELHRILFNKPIESKKVFSFDFANPDEGKKCIDRLQFLHKDSVSRGGLDFLWNKTQALDPLNVAALLYSPQVIRFLKQALRRKFKSKFSDAEVEKSIDCVVRDPIPVDSLKFTKQRPVRRPKEKADLDAVRPIEPEATSLPDSGTLSDASAQQ